MSLEDELVIIQFAQGLHPEADLLDSFRQLDATKQHRQLFDLLVLLKQPNLTDAEIEQANAHSSSKTVSNPLFIQHTKLIKIGLRINMAEGELENSYHIVLDLFKKAYQRCFDQEKDSSTSWIYWDLSSSETVQSILIKHKEMVADLYRNTSFRSEFASLAKLWYTNVMLKEELYREPDPLAEPQTHFNFLSYDELTTTSIPGATISKELQGIDVLLNSLRKATSIRYKLDSDQAGRLVLDVMRHHLQETHNMQLDQ